MSKVLKYISLNKYLGMHVQCIRVLDMVFYTEVLTENIVLVVGFYLFLSYYMLMLQCHYKRNMIIDSGLGATLDTFMIVKVCFQNVCT